MPCDKFMELPLEERLDFPKFSSDSDKDNIAYYLRVNPKTNDVEYQFPPSTNWVCAN
jgi:hypothetical protein